MRARTHTHGDVETGNTYFAVDGTRKISHIRSFLSFPPPALPPFLLRCLSILLPSQLLLWIPPPRHRCWLLAVISRSLVATERLHFHVWLERGAD